MHYSVGRQIPRYLLVVLVVACPLLAFGGDDKHGSAAAIELRHTVSAPHYSQSHAMIVEAKEVALPSDVDPSTALPTERRQAKFRPVVRFAPVDDVPKTHLEVAFAVPPQTPRGASESKPQPVLRFAEEIRLERHSQTEAPAPEPSPTIRARPEIPRADAEPRLVVLQQPASGLDLPDPQEPPPLMAEQSAELEEIETFELDLKPMNALTARTKPEAGEMPKNYAAARFAREGAIAHTMGFSRAHVETVMMWEAPAICHRPLYFEDINLERHGHKVPLIQPALSAAHFFGRVPLLPYMIVNEGHRNCQYTLGHYRPGDYAPYSLYIPRLRLDATAAEVAVAAGVILVFP